MKYIVVLIFFSSLISLFSASAFGQLGHGHNLPTSSLGDRNVMLDFLNVPIQTANGMDLKFSLIDQGNNQNIPHVTYIISIYYNDSRVFAEVLHGHGGVVDLRFLDSPGENYKINANYDALAASYVSDFGAPIKVEGPVLSKPGNYSVTAEVTGLDFDNTFLPEPLEYSFSFIKE